MLVAAARVQQAAAPEAQAARLNVSKAPSTDDDGDGWTEQDGDCRDCDPAVHPGAVDAPNYVSCNPGDAGCVCDANNMNCKAPAPADLQIDESCGRLHLLRAAVRMRSRMLIKPRGRRDRHLRA
ncbi:MAG: hypothetical protein U0165_00055 [Polyangiaceae bacterium]